MGTNPHDFKIGDRVRVARECRYGDSGRYNGHTGVITQLELDDDRDLYPFFVSPDDTEEPWPGDWMHEVELIESAQPEVREVRVEVPVPVVIRSKDLSDVLVRNAASAQLAVELVTFLRDAGVTVKFGN